jgi:hypothetical protein
LDQDAYVNLSEVDASRAVQFTTTSVNAFEKDYLYRNSVGSGGFGNLTIRSARCSKDAAARLISPLYAAPHVPFWPEIVERQVTGTPPARDYPRIGETAR